MSIKSYLLTADAIKDSFVYAVRCKFSSKPNVLFISNDPGASYMYRCVHQAEQVRTSGHFSASVTMCGPEVARYVLWFDVVVFHKVHDHDFWLDIVERLTAHGAIILTDVDDPTFDPRYLKDYRGYEFLPDIEKEILREGVGRKILSASHAVIASTNYLADVVKHMKQVGVYVNRNAVSKRQLKLASSLLDQTHYSDKGAVLGYAAGTRSHDFDFAEIASVLKSLMRKFRSVRLCVIGSVDVCGLDKEFPTRVKRLPVLRYDDYMKAISQIDIMVVPLEKNNEFAKCKSEVKFLEAAILGKPTIASNTAGYAEIIEHGITGFVAENEDQWYELMSRLIADAELRKTVGQNAREYVLGNATTLAKAKALSKFIESL